MLASLALALDASEATSSAAALEREDSAALALLASLARFSVRVASAPCALVASAVRAETIDASEATALVASEVMSPERLDSAAVALEISSPNAELAIEIVATMLASDACALEDSSAISFLLVVI